MRFLWGLRTAAPIVIGSCGIAPWRLVLFGFIGAALWGSLVAAAGYFAGQALQQWAGTAWNLVRSWRPRGADKRRSTGA